MAATNSPTETGPIDLNQCPACGNPAVAQCRCPLGDRNCEFGHAWHVCPSCHGRVDGEGDHAVATDHPANWCRECLSKGT